MSQATERGLPPEETLRGTLMTGCGGGTLAVVLELASRGPGSALTLRVAADDLGTSPDLLRRLQGEDVAALNARDHVLVRTLKKACQALGGLTFASASSATLHAPFPRNLDALLEHLRQTEPKPPERRVPVANFPTNADLHKICSLDSDGIGGFRATMAKAGRAAVTPEHLSGKRRDAFWRGCNIASSYYNLRVGAGGMRRRIRLRERKETGAATVLIDRAGHRAEKERLLCMAADAFPPE